MTAPTFPPSPAQGEPAGVTLAEQLSFVEMITKARIFMSDQHDALIAIAASLRSLDAARQQLAELQVELTVIKKLYEESCNAAYDRGDLEKQLAEMRGKVTGLRRWQEAALSWLRADDSPSAFALRRDADDPMLATSQPSRGKCLRCDNTGAVHRADGEYLGDCPDCAQPERQGVKCDHMGCVVNTHTGSLTGECTRCGETFSLPTLAQFASQPPTAGPDGPSDIVADDECNPTTALGIAKMILGDFDEGRDTLTISRHWMVKLIAALSEMGWQPIITAPEDESILVWVVNDTHKTASAMIGYKDVAGNQYWWLEPSGRQIEIFDYRVTHWMPLPSPPLGAS